METDWKPKLVIDKQLSGGHNLWSTAFICHRHTMVKQRAYQNISKKKLSIKFLLII